MYISLRAQCVLLFCCILHIQLCTAQFQLINASEPIVTTVGEDVILPCELEPIRDVTDLTLEWTRPDLDPRFVYVWRSQEELTVLKNPQYVNRTFLFKEELKRGNISLKLTQVKPMDSGTYRCFIPTLGTEAFVHFIVDVPGSPALLSLLSVSPWRWSVELQCWSGGWYPEPELWWWDSERRLSAEHTQTHRRPDGLYNISSRLTVERSTNITCTVSQKDTKHSINSSIEVEVAIRDDLFGKSVYLVVVAVAAVVVLGLVVIIIILILRKRKTQLDFEATENTSQREPVPEPKTEDYCPETIEFQEEESKSCVIIDFCDAYGQYIRLKNNSEEKQQMKGWTIQVKIEANKPLIYIFTVLRLEAEETVTVCAKDCERLDPNITFKVWENQCKWNTGRRAYISLYNNDNKLMDKKNFAMKTSGLALDGVDTGEVAPIKDTVSYNNVL